MSVAIVVPTYNEAQNIPKLVERLSALNLSELRIIIVDDNSPDGTGDVAESMAQRSHGHIIVIHRRMKEGIGPAYIEGFINALKSDAEFVVQMDADLSHLPEDVPRLLEPLQKKEADVVVGSRYSHGGSVDRAWTWPRRLLSRAGNLYIRTVSGVEAQDATSGFKAYCRAALADIVSHSFKSKGFAFQAEVARISQTRRHRVVECPITFMERANGQSKISLYIIVEALWRLLPIRWSR